ncbi:dynein light chain Tctex-type 5-like [Branchiostoma floridae x Branchiostoma belcheri]
MESARSSLFQIPTERPRSCAGASYVSLACEPELGSQTDLCRHKSPQPNTFRLEPENRFSVPTVRDVILTVLSCNLGGDVYEVDRARELTKGLAQDIMRRVKALEYDRMKLVVVVSIGEKRGQCVHVTSRCLWDVQRDNFATASFHNEALYATGTVFGVYYE